MSEGESNESGRAPDDDRVLTLPNLLTAARLAGVPVFLLLLARGHLVAAACVLAAASLTDYLDGVIARALDQGSRLGRLLDPVVDRLYVLAAVVGLVLVGAMPWWFAALVLGRDVWGVVAMARTARYGVRTLPVSFVGKAATFCLLAAFPLLALAHGAAPSVAALARPAAWAFAWWGVALYWLSAGLYHDQAQRLVRRAARATRPAAAPTREGGSR